MKNLIIFGSLFLLSFNQNNKFFDVSCKSNYIYIKSNKNYKNNFKQVFVYNEDNNDTILRMSRYNNINLYFYVIKGNYIVDSYIQVKDNKQKFSKKLIIK